MLAILVHTRECFRHTLLLGGARRHLRWRCRRVARVIHDNWKSCLHVSTVVLRQLNLSSTHPVSASGILYLSVFLKGRQASRKEHRYLASWEETPLLEKPYESFLFARQHSVLAPVLGPRNIAAGRIVLATTDSGITSYSTWQPSWAPNRHSFLQGLPPACWA